MLIEIPVFFSDRFFSPLIWAVSFLIFVFLNFFPSFVRRSDIRIKILSDGADLLCSFLVTLTAIIVYSFLITHYVFGWFTIRFWFNLIAVILAENIIFWNGIIRVYCTATMIGMKWRIIGALVGFVPIVNIVVLVKIISLSRAEVNNEERRAERNLQRQGKNVCMTKYPIVFVHGVFFRDAERFNYWGRIPNELKKNGAVIYYGNQQSALGVVDSAKEISCVIKNIVEQTGCEKVNIIAHSKGGIDCRYAISCLGMSDCVASLTTVNTPHRGCVFAEWILDHASESFRDNVSRKYNSVLKKMGDTNPDFLAAVNDLRASYCEMFNLQVPDMPGIYYQSIGSRINSPMRNIFPLCFSNLFASYFDGPNDGLVTVESAKWGSKFTYISSRTSEGISHADVIDLMRHDKPDFDVREFYVELVSDLKNRGL